MVHWLKQKEMSEKEQNFMALLPNCDYSSHDGKLSIWTFNNIVDVDKNVRPNKK